LADVYALPNKDE
jgi:hypothetical protein